MMVVGFFGLINFLATFFLPRTQLKLHDIKEDLLK